MNQMTLSLDERANIDFVLHLRRRWADTLYPELATQVQEALSNGAENIERTMHDQPSYPWFAWLERGSQKMLWRAVSDVVSAHPNYTSPDGANTWGLELNPDLELPQWYTDWDIHVQPGGVWRNGASARVYELGSKLVMMGENDDYMFHHTLYLKRMIPKVIHWIHLIGSLHLMVMSVLGPVNGMHLNAIVAFVMFQRWDMTDLI